MSKKLKVVLLLVVICFLSTFIGVYAYSSVFIGVHENHVYIRESSEGATAHYFNLDMNDIDINLPEHNRHLEMIRIAEEMLSKFEIDDNLFIKEASDS